MTGQKSNASAPPAPGAGEVWSPGTVTEALWTVLGTLLAFTGIGVFAALYALPTGEVEFRLGGATAIRVVLVVAALTLLLTAAHEVIHGLAMRRFGAQPDYGAAAAWSWSA